MLGENYTDGYYRTIYDVQNRFGYSSMFATVNDNVVENAMSYPWSGANFSDRLWKHKSELIAQLRETLTTGFIRGESLKDMARRLAQRLDVSLSNTMRLMRTESSHIHNVAELAAYKECGFEEYEFLASLGERTCETCGAMDGKRFKLSDKQDGVNFPPLHPNCRCTTIAYDPDDNLEDLKAGELEYEEWYKKYVTNRTRQPEKLSTSGQKMLTKSGEGGIIDIDEKERQFRNKLYNGFVNTTIEHRAQLNHTLSPEWRNSVKQALKAIAEGKKQKPKSRLFRQFDPQLLATAFCGKGELEYRNGSDSFDEFVELSFDVGVTYDSKIGKYVPTNILQIKYGKNGVHVFPTIRKR